MADRTSMTTTGTNAVTQADKLALAPVIEPEPKPPITEEVVRAIVAEMLAASLAGDPRVAVLLNWKHQAGHADTQAAVAMQRKLDVAAGIEYVPPVKEA